MKQIFTLIFLYLSPLGLMAQQDCAHPAAVAPGTYNVAFASGSQPPSPVCAGGMNNNPTMGAWFVYSPTELHTTTIAALGDTDTRVNIYSGSCGSLSCVAGDDDSGPGLACLATFTAEAGVTYYIVFDNNWNGANFSFSLTEAVWVAPLFTSQSVSITGYHNCVVDMNGDYLDDIVAPDPNVVNILYQASNDSGFTLASRTALPTNFMPNWSMAAGDFDKNGFNDLLYGDGNGATVMLANDTGTGFDDKLETPIDVFSQRTNFVDINNDGNLDAFICHDVAPTVYFINNGTGGGIFHQSGTNGSMDLGVYPSGGNYGSIWIDYDNDGDIDLFIAKCRGGGDDAGIDELHRNNGDGTFTNVTAEAGFYDHQQAWSSAWADYDNDGDLDVLIGASSNAGGGHKLMKNNGNGTFTNVTAGSGYDTFAPMDIEHSAHDFNNDGFVDVFGGGSQIMFNNGDMTFSPLAVPMTPGPVGDLNNDGFLDVLNGNQVFFNFGNDNNWLTVNLNGIASNKNGIGARVEIYSAGTGNTWTKQIRDIQSGTGFRYMSSLNAHFGLGQTDAIEQVVVKWPSGTIDVIENPDINQPLLITEGETLGRNDVNSSQFTLYPNPAKEVLNISGTGINVVKASIYDLGGRLVKATNVTDAAVPVQQLTKGTYIIIMQDNNGKQHTSKFIKG